MAEIVHGTAIAFGSHGVLLRGPSGAGKSDLALRCLALTGGGGLPALPGVPRLVADDQVVVEIADGAALVGAPAVIGGMIEVRGVGIFRLPVQDRARLALVVDLVAGTGVERLPEAGTTAQVAGLSIPALRLDPFEASAPLKVLLALVLALAAGGAGTG